VAHSVQSNADKTTGRVRDGKGLDEIPRVGNALKLQLAHYPRVGDLESELAKCYIREMEWQETKNYRGAHLIS
jgi:hypothetical protein